jgi:hypothetical protein
MTMSIEQAAINLAVAFTSVLPLPSNVNGIKRRVTLWQQAAAIIVVAARCHFRNRVIKYIGMGET